MLSAVVNAAEVAKVCRLDPKPYLCSDVSTPRDESISTLATCQWPRDAARARGSSRTTLSAHGQLPAILPRASRQRVRLLGASEAEVSAHLQGVVEVVSASLPASISVSHRRACPASSNACRPSTQHSGCFSQPLKMTAPQRLQETSDVPGSPSGAWNVSTCAALPAHENPHAVHSSVRSSSSCSVLGMPRVYELVDAVEARSRPARRVHARESTPPRSVATATRSCDAWSMLRA
mmetsp:Transcript_21517/g.66710  ORF Transcript_21517/g.66710 Transcript_21517/m.66710 type:complete len:235 (+) Transcript_21517:57-761(+)